ncbi:MAG: hypothetical protein NT007_09830 [Candidatus Kapabacteria bacterium]|nr:hypothetical protein [Candidatus Kapabacteria bacterium]
MITLDTSNLKENLTSSNLAEELWEKYRKEVVDIEEDSIPVVYDDNFKEAISEAVERTKQVCAEEFMASNVPELFLCLDDVLIFKKEIYETILQTKKG